MKRKLVGLALIGATIFETLRRRAQPPAPRFTPGPGAAVGDSITAHGGFVEVLSELPGYHWDNHGVVGDSTAAILRRADQWALPRYRHFVVMAGLNDFGGLSAARTIDNLRAIYRRARQHGARLIALTSTPWREYRSWSSEAQGRQDQVNRWIHDGAEGLVDVAIDVYSPMEAPRGSGRLNPDFAAPDGLHLNRRGQLELGRIISRRFLG